MSHSLSKEDESYKQFKSLRDKFSSPANGSKSNVSITHSDKPRNVPHKPRRAGYDPRANAPPLLPLVEEEDQQPDTNIMDKLERLVSQL